MDAAGLPALKAAIRHNFGCESNWVESVYVEEKYLGKTIWTGDVEVFDLIGHPKAVRAYAWSHTTHGAKRNFVTVLAVPPIDSPQRAVQALIASDLRSKRS